MSKIGRNQPRSNFWYKYKLSENGFPIIKNSLAWFDCVKWKYYPGGDHQILVAEVKSFFANKYDPLIFWNGSLV